ncbi:MAG: hypothetical protein LBG11_11480, partial [Bifidobacteriaceae bacterium]|nr:hypothetical protein [Bifidobacteriaceae bacterium]
MLRFTLRQMRLSLRHLMAGAVAVMVATAFIAAVMAGSGVMRQTIENIMAQPYAKADLVIARGDFPAPQRLPATAVEDAKASPAVADAFLPVAFGGEAATDSLNEWVSVRAVSTDPALATWPADEGREPIDLGEASVGSSLAKRLDLAIGGQFDLTVAVYPRQSDPIASDTEPAETTEDDSAEETDGGSTASAEGGAAEATEGDSTASAEGGAAEATQGDSTAAAEGEAWTWTEGDSAEGTVDLAYPEPETHVARLTVTGLFDDSGPSFSTRPQVQTPLATIELLGLLDGDEWAYDTGSMLISLRPEVEDTPAVRAEVAEALAAAWAGTSWAEYCGDSLQAHVDASFLGGTPMLDCAVWVMSPAEAARERARAEFGDVDLARAVALVFGLVSLLTA